MRLCTFREYEGLSAGVLIQVEGQGERVVSLEDLNDAWGQDFGPDVSALIRRGQWRDLERMVKQPLRKATSGWKPENLRYAAPYADPRKIWGIGLNFPEHATDLGAQAKEGHAPGSFMRPATSITDPAGPIRIPEGVGRVTAEAELGIILGEGGRDLSPKEAEEAILGFVPVIDVTAEEMLRKDARYLTRAKSFDAFMTFGPWIVTRDEWSPQPTTRIRTVHNGKLHKENLVGNMRMGPYEIVAEESKVLRWERGDILLTGTPGAAHVLKGDKVRAEISGLPTLETGVQ